MCPHNQYSCPGGIQYIRVSALDLCWLIIQVFPTERKWIPTYQVSWMILPSKVITIFGLRSAIIITFYQTLFVAFMYDIIITYCLFDCGFGPFPVVDTQINHGQVFPIELQWASCDIKTFPQNASLHVHLIASIPTYGDPSIFLAFVPSKVHNMENYELLVTCSLLRY